MKYKFLLLSSILIVGLTSRCGMQIKTMSGTEIKSNDEIYERDCENYWDECIETVTSPPVKKEPDIVEDIVIMKGKLPDKGFAYVYGGKTAFNLHPSTSGGDILTCYLDGSDYSGVTVALGEGHSVNMEKYRKGGTAGIAFWGKGGPGTSSIYLGVIDDDSDNKKVQTKIRLGDFEIVDTTWRYYMIPIRKFQNNGRYWDENKKAEVMKEVDWSRINEFRFSVNKRENPIDISKPVKFYVDDLKIIKKIPGHIDHEEYWNNFSSDAKDVVINNFLTDSDKKWQTSSDPESRIDIQFIKTTNPRGSGDALSITYNLSNWCDAIYDFRENNSEMRLRNWSNHWGLKFDVYTERPFQSFSIQIQDAGDELFITTSGAAKGWSEIIVPFKEFYKFPYYQPPQAKHNGILDLDSVVSVDFKPAGEGTKSTFFIDNIRITNDRKAKVESVPEKVTVSVSGDITNKLHEINPGIFGINVALWDGDLINKKTIEQVKAINHKVLRYPGGLRADVDNWKEVLAKKDWMIDTDEFLDFCEETGTTPMITVNFGTGSIQDAVDWVKYTNIQKKAGVKYWEIGNELYADWHPNVCSPQEYGKRAREFIIAMKKVDPDIHITVVWMLMGDWNKKVFEYTKDIADGVNVHHYPQGHGEENDAGLLSSPQTLDDIITDIKKQLKEYGEPQKEYEIWLTEWNSVDSRPSPQILTIVNGVFVADYLGMLAKHNIEQASYWNVHNDISERGGDYGYLSRTGAPDGDIVPRPSYWAFKMANECLFEKTLLQSKTNDIYISSYLADSENSKSLMLINKYPETKAQTAVSIPGFEGKAELKQLHKGNAANGPEIKTIEIKKGSKLTLPPYSITTITLQ